MEWKDIPGTNYRISREGSIIGKRGVELVHLMDKDGYKVVNLYCKEKKGMRLKKVHRLIAEAFIPNPDNLPSVDHINRDRSDNRIENLRWTSKFTNAQNRSSNGSVWFNQKTNRWRCQFRMFHTYIQKTFETEQDAREWYAQTRRELNHPAE